MMALTWHTQPSAILRIDDAYEAWCIDEAMAEYAVRIRRGDKPRLPGSADDDRPKNNLELIRKIKEAQRGI